MDGNHTPIDEGSCDKAENNVGLLSDPLKLADAQYDRQAVTDLLISLPKQTRQRIKALRKLQLDATHIEAEFYRKVHELECQYAQRFQPLSDKRAKIVDGSHEPTDEECDFPLVDEELSKILEEKLNINLNDASGDMKEDDGESATKGIPDFWFTIWKNVELLADMIQEHDEPILSHLLDIEAKLTEDPMSFTLLFHWSPNEWFTDPLLTKQYFLKCEPEKDSPFEFDGPEIVSCKGCKIDWKPSRNVTLKLLKKKQKHKQRGATRYVTKQVKADSFFNFFDPPAIPESPEAEEEMLRFLFGQMSPKPNSLRNIGFACTALSVFENIQNDEESRELLNADFEIGQYLRDRVIPRAVLYYTGEAHDDDDSFDEDEEDDDEDLEDEDDEGLESDEDGDGDAVNGNVKENGVHATGREEKPQECKQQ